MRRWFWPVWGVLILVVLTFDLCNVGPAWLHEPINLGVWPF